MLYAPQGLILQAVWPWSMDGIGTAPVLDGGTASRAPAWVPGWRRGCVWAGVPVAVYIVSGCVVQPAPGSVDSPGGCCCLAWGLPALHWVAGSCLLGSKGQSGPGFPSWGTSPLSSQRVTQPQSRHRLPQDRGLRGRVLSAGGTLEGKGGCRACGASSPGLEWCQGGYGPGMGPGAGECLRSVGDNTAELKSQPLCLCQCHFICHPFWAALSCTMPVFALLPPSLPCAACPAVTPVPRHPRRRVCSLGCFQDPAPSGLGGCFQRLGHCVGG